jgi:hypothetical protein
MNSPLKSQLILLLYSCGVQQVSKYNELKRSNAKELMSMDLKSSYMTLFSLLWYMRLPCFDIKGLTAEKNGDSALLKDCTWKGLPVACSAIFTTFPTDQVNMNKIKI